jgi:hypothetical protein
MWDAGEEYKRVGIAETTWFWCLEAAIRTLVVPLQEIDEEVLIAEETLRKINPAFDLHIFAGFGTV